MINKFAFHKPVPGIKGAYLCAERKNRCIWTYSCI